MNVRYPRGSEWRRWDLHMHTPASFLWKGQRLRDAKNQSETSQLLEQMCVSIDNSDLAVVCFTDYWTFDGYFMLCDYLNSKGASLRTKVLPGMELRVEAPTDFRLNLQVVFSDELSPQRLSDFKSALHTSVVDRPLSDEAIRDLARELTPDKAKEHGFEPPRSLDDMKLLDLGSSCVEITRESLQDALKPFSKSSLVVMPYDKYGGISKLDWKTQPQSDLFFMRLADAFETTRPENIDLFSGRRTAANESFFDNFFQTIGGRAKPVAPGSDAHCFADYGKFPNDVSTWIKSDPTFQGLLQILWEPQERVRVQREVPEQKTPYLVIKDVRFLDQNRPSRFSADWINLNQNLNAIIGGKSSGKSLLLHHIAKAVAPDKLEQLEGLAGYALPSYSTGVAAFDFEVKWNDGKIDRLLEQKGEERPEITYIPQLYINFLAEREGRQNLRSLIEDILAQNENYSDFVSSLRTAIQESRLIVSGTTEELVNLRSERSRLVSEAKAIGESRAINEEIARLKGLMKDLEKQANFSPEELANYQLLLGTHERAQKRVVRAQSAESAVAEAESRIEGLTQSMMGTLHSWKDDFPFDVVQRRVLDTVADRLSNELLATMSGFTERLVSTKDQIAEKITLRRQRLEGISAQLSPYQNRVRDQTRLEELGNALAIQRKKLNELEELRKKIRAVEAKGQKKRDALFEEYARLSSHYKSICGEVNKPEYANIDRNLSLSCDVQFDISGFSSAFGDLFDRRGNFRSIFGECFDDRNEYVFDRQSHSANIQTIYDKLTRIESTAIRYKTGIDPADAHRKLFDDYFYLDYNIHYNDDDILTMSPGKRGLVLLQLILHISNATHPILVDQPEDNLDNRTIYTDLRDFVRMKKSDRQIIIVTHNANLVVSTDAENVIVCNQAGQQAGKENRQFRFEYASGSLEDTWSDVSARGVLYQSGIREQVCDVLEGGEEAFRLRERKYGFGYHRG